MKSYCPIIYTVVYHEINFPISAKDGEATMMMRAQSKLSSWEEWGMGANLDSVCAGREDDGSGIPICWGQVPKVVGVVA